MEQIWWIQSNQYTYYQLPITVAILYVVLYIIELQIEQNELKLARL